MCVLNPYLTPVRAGLILLAMLLLGLIVAQVTAMPDPGDIRTGTISESSGRPGGVKGLRGSLP